MKYSEFVSELQMHAEEAFAAFQRRLIPTKQKILGVRTPTLRRMAKKYAEHIEEIFAFPDEYYEVTFIKLTLVAALPYEEFVKRLEKSVSLIDNWATCDSFKARCIRRRKEEFLSVLETLFIKGGEFYERYVLVVLLSEYVEDEYLHTLEEYLRRAHTQAYYISMAAAWLTAEILVKRYEYGVQLLQKGFLEKKTHDKAIQKAVESKRLNKAQKEYLRSLKIK